MAYMNAQNQSQQLAPSAQGAPINTASSRPPPTALQQYEQQPAYLASNPMGSSFENMQQAPQWLQQMTQKQVVGPQAVGAYDPSLQMRDIYSQYQPGLQNAYSMHGADAINNPYFAQGKEFRRMSSQKGFNPFEQQLGDYELYRNDKSQMDRNLREVQRNPFTGEIESWGDSVFNPHAFYDPMDRKYNFKAAQDRMSRYTARTGYDDIFDIYGISAEMQDNNNTYGRLQNRGQMNRYYRENPMQRMSGKSLIKY